MSDNAEDEYDAEDFHILGSDAPEHAWVGGEYENFETLARSFLEAADTLAKTWAESPHERLALPILQTYRHGIELGLKGLCEQAARLVTFGLRMGLGKEEVEGKKTVPEDLAASLGRTHQIGTLVALFHDIVAGLDSAGGVLPASVRAILKHLQELDSNGQAFRYATTWDKTAKAWVQVRPDEEAIPLRNLANDLHHAGWMLVYGASGWLDHYESYLQDMWSEYQSHMSSWV